MLLLLLRRGASCRASRYRQFLRCRLLLCSALLYVLCLLYCRLLCYSACSAVPSSSRRQRRRRCCRRRCCCCCCRCCCVRTTNALLSVCMVLTLTLGRAGGKRVLQTTEHLTLPGSAGHIPPCTEVIFHSLVRSGLIRRSYSQDLNGCKISSLLWM